MNWILLSLLAAAVVAFLLWRRASRGALPPPDDLADQELPPPTSKKELPSEAAASETSDEVPTEESADEADIPTSEDSSPEDTVAPVDTEAAVVSPEPASPPPPPASEAELESLRAGLTTTRKGFIGRIASLFRGKKEIPAGLFDELEEVLVTADIGIKTSTKLLDGLRDRASKSDVQDGDRLFNALREDAKAILTAGHEPLSLSGSPCVILVVGVNGVGKTTTIGKLASHFSDQGHKVVLGAGDTFRAAAVLQLQKWGERTECEVVSGKEGADPSSVIFDTIRTGKENGADIILCDTAGRLHTKAPLMEELGKVGRTAEKALGRPVDHILLVLDATTGQNAIQQTELFKQALPVSGIILTKLDGTAKGGVILGIVDEHQLPVHYIGIGEKVEDLRAFDADAFAKALFDKSDDDTKAA